MDEALYSPVYDEKISHFLEGEFSRIKGECYVDHAGATLYSDNQIKKSFDDLVLSLYTNPHSHGVNGNLTDELIDNIRCRILDHFHTTQDEYSIIFTSGATASLKLVAETFTFTYKKDESIKEFGNFVYLQDNHTSVLGMRDIISERGAKVICLDHNSAFKVLQQNTDKNHSISMYEDNSLFIYPAQCNFSGFKYPLNWIENVKHGLLNSYVGNKSNWYTYLDIASYAATNDLNLSIVKPDFLCLSFYKLFGYPTGIGALLVRNKSAQILKKVYYGGGTVNVILSSKMHHVKKESLHERFEDGTISFLTIISLQHGLQILSDISMDLISSHVFALARYFYHLLLTLHHENGAPVTKIYADSDYEDKNLQGGIISFNVLRSNGEYVGYMEVLNMAALFKIHLRTGCFCNPGACQRHLKLSDKEILKNYDTGYTCGGTTDLINGKPTGAIRVSFGYMSTIKDAKVILHMLKKCFVNGHEVIKYPAWLSNFKLNLYSKMNYDNNVDINGVSNEFTKNERENVVAGENWFPQLCSVITSSNLFKSYNTKKYCKLSKIFVYPIKSCGGYEVQNSWILTSKGLQYDREWMIMTSSGLCLTQKQEPKLCLIKPDFNFLNNKLELYFPGMPSIGIPLNVLSETVNNDRICRGKICGHKIEGKYCGAEISEWLSLALRRPNIKLVRQSELAESKQTSKPKLSFVSQSQYLLINTASVLWLTDQISEDSECDKNTILQRFRGNFLINGHIPFEEIKWKVIQIGNCHFEVEGVCTRCQMVCIDQTTGIKTIEPLRTLGEKFHGKLKFGIYLVSKSQENNVLKIGDDVFYD
ncbi:PREDICTED: molybdenum cofactor sulfurase 3 [Ceratosolen solmsi marchali]|uniref:Molybdenum cofactor sulfurase n=1 Tax=Ceratosolen solmsi marchali TaxID=326594 RepID=A0AAJ6YHC0_9HYME|nr:PREDICTED: molybdenum cofactor sulfurase 3 [Ceratosolen solmsi marchali]